MTVEDWADDGADSRPRLVKAMQHPLRGPILCILRERSATAQMIATEIGVDAEAIGHQLRRLRGEGLIRLDERRARRGVSEHYYRTVDDPVFDDAEYAALSPAQRRHLSIFVVKNIYADLGRALRAGTYEARDDMCNCHMRILTDERGWHELAEIHREAAEKVVTLRRRLEARTDRAEAVIPAASAILCFELPSLVGGGSSPGSAP